MKNPKPSIGFSKVYREKIKVNWPLKYMEVSDYGIKSFASI